MKPWLHAESSARKYGGKAEDYLPIHDAMDSSKSSVADFTHRALFHHSFGCFVMERIFGTYITNSAGKKVQVRDIAEQHVIEDLGCIPTVQDYLENINKEDNRWMSGPIKSTRVIPMDDQKEASPTFTSNEAGVVRNITGIQFDHASINAQGDIDVAVRYNPQDPYFQGPDNVTADGGGPALQIDDLPPPAGIPSRPQGVVFSD